MNSRAWLASTFIFLGGCAHTPDTEISYFPAVTTVNVKITRLLTCNKANEVFSSQSVTASTSNAADYSAAPNTLDLGLLNSALADTSFTAEFYEDGRLKGINVTETGKAKEIIKSAVSLAKLVLPGVEGAGGRGAIEKFPKLCAVIADAKDKMVTLKYEADIQPKPDAVVMVPLSPESQAFQLQAAAKDAEVTLLELVIHVADVVRPAVATPESGKDGVSFKYPARVTLALHVEEAVDPESPLWEGHFPIAQLGSDGWLPIARAPALGKSTTIIDLQDNGALKKVSYGSETGTASAIDSAAESVDLVDGMTDAERTAAADAERKRMKAEHDLLKCKADPTAC